MKKITLLAIMMLPLMGISQITFESTTNYGKLIDITYDASVPNKLYAATQGNHLVVSTDNAATWSILLSNPGGKWISDVKLAPGNQSLTFTTENELHFYNLATQAVTSSVAVPQSGVADANPSYFVDYSIFDATGQIILANTNFQVGFDTFGKTFYTTNGGTTWQEIYYTVDHNNVFIENVAISPASPSKLFLARGNGDTDIDGGLWISDDAGATWSVKIGGIPVDVIAFNPANSQEILVGTGISFGEYPENLYRSFDNGTTWNILPITWSSQSLDNITEIVYNPINSNKIIVLEENEIAISNDGGNTWSNTIYEAGVSTEYYFGIKASYNPFNENQVAITTDLFPQMSSDGGLTLTQIHAVFGNVISVTAATYAGGSHLYYGANGGRFHKNLASATTQAYNVASPTEFIQQRNYVFADPIVAGRVFTYAAAGMMGGWLSVSTDYAATKTNIMQGFGDDIQELIVDPANTNIIYVAMRSGEDGTLQRLDISDLSNIVITEITTPQVSEMGDGVVTGVELDPSDSNIMYIAKRMKVFKSVDGGVTWVEKVSGLEAILDGDLIWDMQMNPLNPLELTVASSIGAFKTVDGCESWTPILAGYDVRRITYSPINNGVIVGSLFANTADDTSIVYSIDGGSNWETVTPAMLHYAQSFSMDYIFEGNSIHAYLATSDLGVIRYDINNLSLGVNNPVVMQDIQLYPNPASSTITLSAANTTIVSAQIFSVTGQKVIDSVHNRIDVSSLSKGIYIVKAIDDKANSYVAKLIKE